jgi:hypothetical protein
LKGAIFPSLRIDSLNRCNWERIERNDTRYDHVVGPPFAATGKELKGCFQLPASRRLDMVVRAATGKELKDLDLPNPALPLEDHVQLPLQLGKN